MTTSPGARLAEQEALAVTRALMEDRQQDAFLMITGSSNPLAMAFAACGLAAASLRQVGPNAQQWLSDRQQAVAAEEAGPVF